MSRKLTAVFVAIAGVAIGAAGVFACTAGSDVTYDASGTSVGDAAVPDGFVRDEAGRLVRESGVDVVERPEDSGHGSAAPFACTGLVDQDGGCDTTAGRGCCFEPSGPTCIEQIDYPGNFCKNPNGVFLACLSSTADNVCCWQDDGPGGASNTRYRATCDGGVEVCDPTQDGGFCENGKPCNEFNAPSGCKNIARIGFCGTQPATVGRCNN